MVSQRKKFAHIMDRQATNHCAAQTEFVCTCLQTFRLVVVFWWWLVVVMCYHVMWFDVMQFVVKLSDLVGCEVR